MNPKTELSRRTIVITALGLPAIASIGGLAACQASSTNDRLLSFSSLASAEEELRRLAEAKALNSDAAWNWAQTLDHCAQSIEFSMQGFPESKSRLFQSTVGTAAFEIFAWRGRMTHDLAEPIPGAPKLAAGSVPANALARLQAAISSFRQWTKPLQPHFAYGDLDKGQYELAHAMHLANHFSQFKVVG